MTQENGAADHPRATIAADAQASAANSHASTEETTVTPTYFIFKEFLSKEEVATFFDWEHDHQIAKVSEYLDFVARQPAAAQFTSSSRASTSWAEMRSTSVRTNGDTVAPQVSQELLQCLLQGHTKSGFGAFGSEAGFLPQRQLSLAVAQSIKEIGHEYTVERSKKGEIRPPVLNSRSFYLNWCHAEKQKLMDIRLKLDEKTTDPCYRRVHWGKLVVVVDRAMCPDCIQYARRLAAHEQAQLVVQDPSKMRIFPPDPTQEVVTIDVDHIAT